ncbi:MAG TPA: hemolysin III family protein [Clostridiales bacterium]|nr:hemolysin III family protein [Clostridiales bacterium]
MFKKIKHVEYSKKEEILNVLSHLAGAFLAGLVLYICVKRSLNMGGLNRIISALIYGLTMLALYLTSAVYHGLPAGPYRQVARVVDYSMVFLLIAATATPIALVGLYDKARGYAIFIFVFAWFCALAGIIMSVFFFEKTRLWRMILYVGQGIIMFGVSVDLLGLLNKNSFLLFLFGGAVFVAGMIFLRLGVKREYMHAVFHVFALAGSAIHFYAMLKYVFVLKA